MCNHSFVDGNKRTGLLAALTFLQINGIKINQHSDELYTLTLGVAEGRTSKGEISKGLERIVKEEMKGKT